MPKRIEDLLTAYKYWVSRYRASSNVNDFQKKTATFKHLTEAANNQGISNDDLEKLISR